MKLFRATFNRTDGDCNRGVDDDDDEGGDGDKDDEESMICLPLPSRSLR